MKQRVWIPECRFYQIDGDNCSEGGILPPIQIASACESHTRTMTNVYLRSLA